MSITLKISFNKSYFYWNCFDRGKKFDEKKIMC